MAGIGTAATEVCSRPEMGLSFTAKEQGEEGRGVCGDWQEGRVILAK